MFVAKQLGLLCVRYEQEGLGVGTPEEEGVQELHVLMAHCSASHKAYIQFKVSQSRKNKGQSTFRLKQNSSHDHKDDGENIKKLYRFGDLKK